MNGIFPLFKLVFLLLCLLHCNACQIRDIPIILVLPHLTLTLLLSSFIYPQIFFQVRNDESYLMFRMSVFLKGFFCLLQKASQLNVALASELCDSLRHLILSHWLRQMWVDRVTVTHTASVLTDYFLIDAISYRQLKSSGRRWGTKGIFCRSFWKAQSIRGHLIS